MPIYEYLCEACGEETEVMQRMSDPPATECPHCHAEKLVKQVSAAGFRLKGAGWYETDFKQDKKRNLVGDTAPITGGEEKPKTTGGTPVKSAESSSSPEKTSDAGSSSGTSSSASTSSTPAPASPGKTTTSS